MKNLVCILALIIISLFVVTSVKAICPIYKTSIAWQAGTSVFGYSTTELTCQSIYYQNPALESVFVENATLLDSGYAEGDQQYDPATLYFTYNYPNYGQTYSVFSDHYLVTYYQVYVPYWGGGWYWYDPWRYGFIGIGNGGYEGPDYLGGGYGNVYYWEIQYLHIGSTSASVIYSGLPPPPPPSSGCSAGYTSLGGIIASEPTAEVINNKVVAFARGTDNAIYYQYSSGGNFSGWNSLGGGTYQSPMSTVINGTLYLEVVGTEVV